MKLIRLTTEHPDAFFDCNFNDGIEVAPNSTIALQSVSAALEGGSLAVNATNNGITYQVKDGVGTVGAGNGGVRTVTLDSVLYNKTNSSNLLKNIADKLNNDAKWVSAVASGAAQSFNKIVGLEWNVSLQGGRTLIEYLIGNYDLASATNFLSTLAVLSGGNWAAEGTAVANTAYTTTMIANQYLSKGNGFVRAKTANLFSAASEDASGFYVGLTRDRVGNMDFTLNQMDYAIRVTRTAAGAKYWTQKLDSGGHPVAGATGTIPSLTFDDIIEIAINGDRVELNIWVTGATEPITLADFQYDNTELYPFITFNGTRANAAVTNVRMSTSPFDKSGLSAGPPRIVGAKTNNFIRFESETLANFLGFSRTRIPTDGFINEVTASYLGTSTFTAGISINGFLIQLLNISVDSYDSLKEQRENILSVIPSEDGNGNLNYMPSSPIFIDLLNEEKLSLRNIRVRIVNTDYSPLTLDGIGLITLLIN